MCDSSLIDVKFVNINHRESWQGALSRCFKRSFKKKLFRNIFLSTLTLGYFAYKKYQKAKRSIAQALAARKLYYFKALQEHIEKNRREQLHLDPRQCLNATFMKVQSEKVDTTEEALEFKAIYYPSELLLFITNPIRENKGMHVYRKKQRIPLNSLRVWHEMKKKARINQYRQIQRINNYSNTLRKEYCLTIEGIHDRLPRTSVCKKGFSEITKFRELQKAFQEILVAYQDFEELGETNSKLYYLIDTLSKTSRKDIETLQTYLDSRYLPRDLPLENRRQLIQLANQQEVLYHMSEEQQFTLCALVLNKYQWDFLLSIQKMPNVTLGLLDWAFESSFSAMEKELSFIEKICEGAEKKVKEAPEVFPSINEKIREEDQYHLMTVDFGKELNREWPSFQLYENDYLFYQSEKIEALSLEKLLEVYREIRKLCQADDFLFSLLQQAFSQVGKQAFRLAIEEEVLNLLGTKSEYFLPIVSNSNITAVKKSGVDFEIRYSFEQLITRRAEVEPSLKEERYMVIAQPLHKIEGKWVSPKAKIEIATKRRGQ